MKADHILVNISFTILTILTCFTGIDSDMPTKVAKPRTEIKPKESKKLAQFFCNQFNLEYSFYRTNEDYNLCWESAVKYFDKMDEPQSSVTEYAEFCKGMDITAHQSIEIMNHLVNYGWEMKTAIILLHYVDLKIYTIAVSKHPKISLNEDDWFNYNFGNFSLGKCVEDFDESKYEKDLYTVFIKSLKHYKSWWSSEQNNGSNNCDCGSAIGLGVIWFAKTVEGKDENERDIFEFYKKFCLDTTILYHFWSLKHYIAISKGLNLDHVFKFLNDVYEISIGGWLKNGEKSEWPIEFIADYIGLNNDNDDWKTEYKNRIRLIYIAISISLSHIDFNDYIKMTDKAGGVFVNTGCKYDVLVEIAFMKYEENWENDLSYFYDYKKSGKYMYWEIYYKKNDFFDYLSLLIDAFKNEPESAQNCSLFAELLIKMEKLFGLSDWTYDQLITKINYEKTNVKSLTAVYKNLKNDFHNAQQRYRLEE